MSVSFGCPVIRYRRSPAQRVLQRPAPIVRRWLWVIELGRVYLWPQRQECHQAHQPDTDQRVEVHGLADAVVLVLPAHQRAGHDALISRSMTMTMTCLLTSSPFERARTMS